MIFRSFGDEDVDISLEGAATGPIKGGGDVIMTVLKNDSTCQELW